MAETPGMAEIRGIDIDKLAKGFADEELVFKKFVTVAPTSAREIRWYQKTAGFLNNVTTSGMTSNFGETDHLTRPTVIQQSWTRQTSYVKTFLFESPLISDDDIKDSDVDVLASHVRDVTRKVMKDVNSHIYNILTENQTPVNILTTASTAAWDAGSGQDPIKDVNTAIRKIRENNYEPTHLLLSPKDIDSLMTWLISTKGASIPSFSSRKVEDAVLMEFLGLKVVVSNSVVADSATVAAPQRAVTYKQFTPVSAIQITEPHIGLKIRVREQGVALLTDPKAVHLITNTQA